jgi:23S rRNA (cytosine1962-C5)-methyltransferase
VSIEVTGTATISRKGLLRARRGVPHLQREDVVSYTGDNGPFVDLVDETALPMGTAVWDPRGPALVRLLSSARTRDPVGLVRTRLERAHARRQTDLDGAESGRLVHGEADGVPGITIDRFGPGLLVGIESEPMRPVIMQLLDGLAERIGTSHIVIRDGVGASIIRGDGSRVHFPHGRLELEIDMCAAHARDATRDLERQRTLRRWARGRVLDAFAGFGGYGLQLAEAGATDVVFVDDPVHLSSSIHEDVEKNAVTARIERLAEDPLAWLRARESERVTFDVVVFHPRASVAEDRVQAMQELLEHAGLCTRLLDEGGIFALSPADDSLDDDTFIGVVQDAAARSRRRLQVLARLGPGPDHPTLAGVRLPPSLLVARVLQTA